MTSKKKSIVVLTGAGISAESGIRTFRAADGLWENHAIEDVASPEGFERNPQLVQEFYNQRRKQLAEISTALRNCDVFISVGTSGHVYPAAGFVREVPHASKKIEINLASTAITSTFDEHLIGLATEKVPSLVRQLLEATL